MNKVKPSLMTAEQFGQTAVKLSKSPLGIIALFIVLIYAFASLVLGLTTHIEKDDRTILVWFLALFPVFVFSVFAWIVNSPNYWHLYSPGDFPNKDDFIVLAYGQSAFDNHSSIEIQPEKSKLTTYNLDKNATGNLYWLGHDLMWTADTLLRQGPVEQVIIGLEQALHHLLHVGLKETKFGYDLQDLLSQIQCSKELPSSLRDNYATKIGAIIDRIGATLETAQGNFQVPPHWNRIRS